VHHLKLLPLPLLLLSLNTTVSAEHISLPTISVDGVTAEDTPYALPLPPLSSSDTGQLVKRLPGANVNNNGPLTSIVQYRGLYGDRVNVLIDGVQISQAGPNRMDAPLSYIPASRVEEVALYRGIAPVHTGIETIGGTVIANSRSFDFSGDEEFQLRGNANAGYTSNGDSYYSGITAAAVNDTHRFQVAGSIDRGDDLEFDGGTIDPSEHERDTIGINYGFQKLGHELELDFEHHDTGKTGTPALPMDIISADGENYKIKFGKDLSNGGKFNARINYQDAEHRMDNYTMRTPPTMTMGMMTIPMPRYADTDVKSSGFNFNYQQGAWNVGFDADQAEHNANMYDPTNTSFYLENYNNAQRDRYSIFGEWAGNISPTWTSLIGTRLTRVEMDADEVDASMAMMNANLAKLRDDFNNADRDQDDNLIDIMATFTNKVNDHLDIELGLAHKQRAPSYQERYLWATMESTSGLADGNNYVGDVDLDAETAYQLELGLDWHTASAGISPRAFYHRIDDYIQGVASTDATVIAMSTMMGDATPLQYSNVDAELYGLDANWFYSMTRNWQLDGTVSYVRGKRRDTGDNLYRIAPLTARTMLNYIQPTWRLGFEAVTVAGQDDVSDENDEQETSGYALFNLLANYQATEALTLSAGVNNILDREYSDHLGGYNRISDNDDIGFMERLPGLGRSVYAGINFDW